MGLVLTAATTYTGVASMCWSPLRDDEMDMTKTYASGVAAAKDYFGPKPGGEGTASEFMKEWKELTDADKTEITEGLRQIGYQISK